MMTGDGEWVPVSRVGETVRRPVGPWTPAVHALLRHLEDVGFDGSPRVLGIDDQGREVLSFVDGEEGHHARRAVLHSDPVLAEVARLIRRFHEAVAGFVPPAGARWRFLVGAPRDGIVCHNDLAPVNTVYVDDRPAAFIDWEYAAPAPPLWDLACAVWSFVPLSGDAFCRKYGYSAAPRGPRLRLFCDAYGLDGAERENLLDTVRARQLAMVETVRRRAGTPTSAAQAAVRRWLDDIAHLGSERENWQRYLS